MRENRLQNLKVGEDREFCKKIELKIITCITIIYNKGENKAAEAK